MEKATRRKSMSIAEEDAFILTFEELMEELTSISEYQDISRTMEWVRRVLEYNVPGGKQIRGRGVIAAFHAFVDEPGEEDTKLTYIIGWCIEIFQAAFLMTDDIIDNSETRRGRLAWYLVDNIGDNGINDASILADVFSMLLDRYFYNKPYYAKLVNLFNDIFFKTSLGQALDIQTSKQDDFSGFTMQLYKKIVHYKTCYYTFYLPVACALIMIGKTEPEDWMAVEDLILDIGELFQVQDDYLDCYGNPIETGKIGTDIAENKCSWLIVTALERSDESQRKILQENYGKGKETSKTNEIRVKEVFDALDLEKAYHEFEDEIHTSILNKIDKLSHRIPREVFYESAEVIRHRNK